MRYFRFALLILFNFVQSHCFSFVPGPEVPHKLQFAGISLTIRDDARASIQKDVDALTHSPKYFIIKVERARIYFPIIEQIFKEEDVPLDLMFLALQESSLTPDAVSTSNAVGYWQFKAATAGDFGLVVNEQVDERMNIAAASRAAARYFKKSNSYFDNWLLVVQSYQMGIGGTRRLYGEQFKGTRHMDVTMDTYWYVRKFLAHKIAFETSWRGDGAVALTVVPVSRETSLADLSRRAGVDHGRMLEYNRWLKADAVPGDRTYSVIVPKGNAGDLRDLASVSKEPRKSLPGPFVQNGRRVIRAGKGESLAALASRADVSLVRFKSWNDLDGDKMPSEGELYYLERKGRTAAGEVHQASGKETLWTISQQYGVRLRVLRKLNPGLPAGNLAQGTVIRLTGKVIHPGSQPFRLDPTATFEFTVRPLK